MTGKSLIRLFIRTIPSLILQLDVTVTLSYKQIKCCITLSLYNLCGSCDIRALLARYRIFHGVLWERLVTDQLFFFKNTQDCSAIILRLLHTVFHIWPPASRPSELSHMCQTPPNTVWALPQNQTSKQGFLKQSILHCHFGCFQFGKTYLKRISPFTFNHFRRHQSRLGVVMVLYFHILSFKANILLQANPGVTKAEGFALLIRMPCCSPCSPLSSL